MMGARAVLPALSCVALMGCEREDTFNLKVSVSFAAGDDTQVFSEVIAFRVRHRAEMFKDFAGAQLFFTRIGEAVLIDSGDMVYLASYLGGRVSASRALAAATPGAEINDDWWGRISQLTEERTIPPEHWPAFFAVPAGGVAEDMRVLEAAEVAELGVTRVTLQATADAPDLGSVASELPWTTDITAGVLCQDALLGPAQNRPDCARILKAQLQEEGDDV